MIPILFLRPNIRFLESPGDNYTIAIGLAKLRLDGFISIETSNEEGVLTTKLFQFKGSRLAVNADAVNSELAVEILEYKNLYCSADIIPINGFTLSESVSFKGNNVRPVMT